MDGERSHSIVKQMRYVYGEGSHNIEKQMRWGEGVPHYCKTNEVWKGFSWGKCIKVASPLKDV